MAKILIVDDDANMVAVLTELLKEHHHETIAAGNADRAFELYVERTPDLVLVDIEMPEGRPTGLELLQQVRETRQATPVVMITGNATKERAIAALRAGAADFIEKPFRIEELVKRVENALFRRRGEAAIQENVELKKQLRDRLRFDGLVGDSAPMQAVYRMMERVANTDATVLVLGESGTGKELVAKALHYNSRRAPLPFVAVNCAALPEHLLESELFGHRKGAFTGAAFDKLGLFQYADGGTIFLDEVGSMALGLQSKLLRFLQDKEVRRVGDTETVKVDVRVIAATNEPLQKKLEERQFREDLYYRLSVIPIELPPLRRRVTDIPLLVAHFAREIAHRNGTPLPSISDEVLNVFVTYRWPGNVRELQNAMERACALCEEGTVRLKDLPPQILESVGLLPKGNDEVSLYPQGAEVTPLRDFLHQQEVRYIEQVIQAVGGNKEEAAKRLGISIATLYRKLAPIGTNEVLS